jgi:hypothetical protein
MKDVAQLLNEMTRKGVIDTYAVFVAVAQMRYTEAVATMYVDILIAFLRPIYKFCEKRGFFPEGEAIRVGDWPVQFIPAFDKITEEAMKQAETAEFEGISLRVVRADYLAVIALATARAKDFTRILSLLEIDAVSQNEIEQLANHFGLQEEWKKFKEKFIAR